MALGTPDTAAQVEDRLKADVQREAPDSNPYLRVHWLRSVLAGLARRIFDFYRDLNRTEQRLLPDTADEETAPRWGNIYVGAPNTATAAGGFIVGTGTAGGFVDTGETLTANGQEYTVTIAGTVIDNILAVSSITRSGSTATVTMPSDHNLSSFIPVTIVGADQAEYNVVDTAIIVTSPTQFQYQVTGAPATPATGSIDAEFTTVVVEVESTDFSDETNLDLDTEVSLQSPIVDVDDSFFVTFGAVGGGTNTESNPDYKKRYLSKIRNPVANFNSAKITEEALKVSGVTRVFVEEAGTQVGTIAIDTLTRDGDIAKAVTLSPHGFEDGNRTTVNGADQGDYNVTDVPIIIGDTVTFYYLVAGTPTTPATGTINAAATIALGQVRTFFMRDNDDDPIPSASEVQDVKDQIDTIRPATTSVANNIVSAPVPVPQTYTFTELTPNTGTMQAAITANLEQFHSEETIVSVSVTEKQYDAAIQNTVDPDTGDTVATFTLSSPSGDIDIDSGQIATFASAGYP